MKDALVKLLKEADTAIEGSDWIALSKANSLLEFYGFQVTLSGKVKNVKLKDAFKRVFKVIGIRLTQKELIRLFYEGWNSVDLKKECPRGLGERNRWAWFEGKKYREMFEYDNF